MVTERPDWTPRVIKSAARGGRRKVSETVALEIVRHIVERALEPGALLPSEAEMVTIFRASRSSVREALRLLEVQGLIVLRAGSHAGTTVGEVKASNLAQSVILHMHFAGITYDELLETLLLTEPLLAELAARNPDQEKKGRLLGPFLQDGGRTPHAGVDFHTLISELANNRAFALMHNSFGHIVADHVVNELRPLVLANEIANEHVEIARAVLAGDAAKARELMATHGRLVAEIFREQWPHKVGERISYP